MDSLHISDGAWWIRGGGVFEGGWYPDAHYGDDGDDNANNDSDDDIFRYFSIFDIFIYHYSYQSISCHLSLSIPPETIPEPLVFWCFQGI